MDHQQGHAKAADLGRLRLLRERIHGGLHDEGDVLDHALLHFEPLHQEDDAISLLEAYVERAPESWKARVWLAYLYQHHRMDGKSLREAQRVLTPLAERTGAPRATALMLASSIGRDLGELDVGAEAELLEAAVREEPSWPLPHSYLANCYRRLGRRQNALDELDAALANVGVSTRHLEGEALEFEIFFTGRAGEGLADRLNRMRSRLLNDGP